MINPKNLTKRASILCLLSVLAVSLVLVTLPQTVQADRGNIDGRWVITATNVGGYDGIETLPGALYTVDSETDTLYGPFLEGQLGDAGGGLFDISVTPDGRTAIVSNFGNCTVYFVDVSDPTDLHLLGAVNCSFFTEDTAITSDGKYALVVDGGFSTVIASIDIATRTLIENVTVAAGAQAVSIAPDGTIVTVDYFASKVQTLRIDSAGHITNGTVYDIPLSVMAGVNVTDRPVNVGIAPDGKTVLVMPTLSNDTLVYQLTAPGTLAYVGKVEGLPAFWHSTMENWQGSRQSVAFNNIGTKAYVLSNGIADAEAEEWYNNTISVLNINGPGSVSLSAAYAATISQNSSSQLFGVDVVTVANNKLYIGNPTISGGVTYLNVVNLDDFSVSIIPVGQSEEAVISSVATIPYNAFAVGGESVPVNILQVLSPYILVAILGVAAIATLFVYKRKTA